MHEATGRRKGCASTAALGPNRWQRGASSFALLAALVVSLPAVGVPTLLALVVTLSRSSMYINASVIAAAHVALVRAVRPACDPVFGTTARTTIEIHANLSRICGGRSWWLKRLWQLPLGSGVALAAVAAGGGVAITLHLLNGGRRAGYTGRKHAREDEV